MTRRSSSALRRAWLLVLLAPLAAAAPSSSQLLFNTAATEWEGEARPARNVALPPMALGVDLSGLGPEDLLLIRCAGQATLGGDPTPKVKFSIEGELLDPEGETVARFEDSAKTKKKNAGWTNPMEMTVRGSELGELDDVFFQDPLPIVVTPDAAGGKEVDTAAVNCVAGILGQPCVPGTDTLCLHGDRFRVEVDWTDPFDGSSRRAQAARLDAESGEFFFFPLNDELLVKVLDGCGDPSGHYWVFYGSLTDVEFTMTVTDTATGTAREYGPDALAPADAVTDTQAFATCP